MKNHILIVEDEVSMLETLKDKFIDEGFRTIEAQNGEEGLDLALKEKPDIILLDLLMPGEGGMKMLENLRKSGEWGKNVPVIILTNLIPGDEILEGIVKDYPSYYLEKATFTLKMIAEKVKETLEGTKHE